MKLVHDELGKKAYELVKDMILSKQLKPGEKIVQDKLAGTLGISRTPLRSALQMLEGEYLVESVPRRGVIVKRFTGQEIIEIYDCRMALEGTAVRLFTERASHSEIQKLRYLFAPFEGKSVEIDSAAYQVADMNFHDSIIRQCGNGFLNRLFQQGNLLACIDLIGLIRPARETLPEHIDIISAIQARDGVLAESRIKMHLMKSKQLIIQRA